LNEEYDEQKQKLRGSPLTLGTGSLLSPGTKPGQPDPKGSVTWTDLKL
jgi:hypothetical protein